ncbi:hypothetical protein P3L10_033230 [Capsicum annuum]
MQNMKRLRILYICDGRRNYLSSPPSSIDSEDIPNDFIEYLSNNLRWVVWDLYRWVALPENFKPQRLVHFDLRWNLLHDLWTKRPQHLPYLQELDLSYSRRLKKTPDFMGMPNLEYLNMKECTILKEVCPTLGYCKKLIQLNLYGCRNLERFPCVNAESLEYLDLERCFRLEKFPEILGRMKPKLKIKMRDSWIRELSLSIIQQYQSCGTDLDLNSMDNLVALPSSIYKLKGLVKLGEA